jgi:hypothetical protein
MSRDSKLHLRVFWICGAWGGAVLLIGDLRHAPLVVSYAVSLLGGTSIGYWLAKNELQKRAYEREQDQTGSSDPP